MQDTLLGEKFFLHQKPGAVHQEISAQTTHHINKGFWCVWTTPSLTVPFSGKKKGSSIFWFRWRNMAFNPSFLFLPFAIFFGSTAFHIPFLDSTSAPLTAGEPLNRWVLRGLAVSWLGSFVRNKKCSRNEVKLSHAVELFYRFGGICCFIGEVFVLRSPLTHFDTESNIIIEPNA